MMIHGKMLKTDRMLGFKRYIEDFRVYFLNYCNLCILIKVVKLAG